MITSLNPDPTVNLLFERVLALKTYHHFQQLTYDLACSKKSQNNLEGWGAPGYVPAPEPGITLL